MDRLPTLLLEELTWPEVGEALEAGFTTIVVGVGAVEQHGPALPLSVDAERGTRLALEVAKRLGKALVAPTIRVGCSEHHMDFPGTLTIRRETLEAVCTDYCTSFARHGFERICLVPSHGGNFQPLAMMLDELDTSAGEGTRVYAYTDLVGFVKIWKNAVDEVAGLGDRVGGHADIAEASEMLVVRPELVRIERAEAGRIGDLDPELVDEMFEKGLRAVSANGVLGDTRGMSEEIGLTTFAAAADVIVAHFREQMGRP